MSASVARVTSLLAALLAASLAGCVGPTPYRPADGGFGYDEQLLERDRARVTFAGNSLTPRATVENYLLYRAAELTLDRGYDHFIIADRDVERRTTYETSVVGYGGWPGYWPGFGPGFWPGHACFHCRRGFATAGVATATSRPRDRYTAYADIVMGQGDKPAGRPEAYDARDLLERLAPQIERPAKS